MGSGDNWLKMPMPPVDEGEVAAAAVKDFVGEDAREPAAPRAEEGDAARALESTTLPTATPANANDELNKTHT